VRIVLSGYADTASIVEAINEGKIYKFIPKPWNDDELKVTISKALDHYFTYQKNVALSRELETKNQELQEINRNLERLVEERTADLLMQNRILTASQNILDSLPVGVVGIDPSGLIVQCNKKGLACFTQEEGNIMGTDRSESLPDEINSFIETLSMEQVHTMHMSRQEAEIDIKGVYMKCDNGQEGIILILEEGSGENGTGQ
jgi:two-component system NtrC family sensor kinase